MTKIESFENSLKFCPTKVSFNKLNGEERTMVCTQCWEWLEENVDEYKKPEGVVTVPDNIIVVWDLEKKAYRRIVKENINWSSPIKYQEMMYYN